MLKNNHLVSIIVPIYNIKRYLDQCIKSLIAQSYKEIEIILVDDGSTDGSSEMCEEYAKADKRIRVIHKENGGLSDARNAGLQNANGDYIGFVDSDDWVSERMFCSLLNACIEQDAQIAVCGMQRVYKNHNENYLPGKEVLLTKEEAITELFLGEMFGDQACTKLYKKDLFCGIEYPLNKQFEDIYTTYKLFLRTKRVAVVNEVLYYYRQRGSSITAKSFNNHKLDLIDAIESIRNVPEISKNKKWDDILKNRINDAYCWTLLDVFQTENRNKETISLEKNLFQKIRSERSKIKKKSRYSSCRYISKLSFFGFDFTRIIVSSSPVRKMIKRKKDLFE